MARVKIEDLEHLSSDDIREIMLEDEVSKKLPEKIYTYITEAENIYEETARWNRVFVFLSRIIVRRFKQGKIK